MIFLLVLFAVLVFTIVAIAGSEKSKNLLTCPGYVGSTVEYSAPFISNATITFAEETANLVFTAVDNTQYNENLDVFYISELPITVTLRNIPFSAPTAIICNCSGKTITATIDGIAVDKGDPGGFIPILSGTSKDNIEFNSGNSSDTLPNDLFSFFAAANNSGTINTVQVTFIEYQNTNL